MPQPHPVDPLRVLQVSDTHLAARAPFSIANWRAVSEFADTAADLVVHTGDISLDGGDDLAFSWREIDRLTAPWRAVPGNHDIGDPEPAADPVDASRRARYHASFGDGSWALVERSWNLVGLDVRLDIANYLYEALASERFRPPEILKRLVAEGKLGRKTGQGFYTWND